jgi:hypothetical protein
MCEKKRKRDQKRAKKGYFRAKRPKFHHSPAAPTKADKTGAIA